MPSLQEESPYRHVTSICGAPYIRHLPFYGHLCFRDGNVLRRDIRIMCSKIRMCLLS